MRAGDLMAGIQRRGMEALCLDSHLRRGMKALCLESHLRRGTKARFLESHLRRGKMTTLDVVSEYI